MSGKWDTDIPKTGWRCVGMEDRGTRGAVCEMCEVTPIRYVHRMNHRDDNHEPLEVGCVCAGKMQGDAELAKARESKFTFRGRWLGRKWKTSSQGNQYLKAGGFLVVILREGGMFKGSVKTWEDPWREHWRHTIRFGESDAAKLAAFEIWWQEREQTSLVGRT